MTENKSRLTKRNPDGSVGINDFRYYNYNDFQKLASKLADYEDIGTTEEFKALKDKAEPKKVDEDDCCPICHTYGKDDNGVAGDYCPECGQALDWQ